MSTQDSEAVYADLKGRVVMVTGGARGIGAAMVRAFAAQGARVHFCDLHREAGAALSRELKEAGAAARFERLDLARESSVRRWVGAVGEREGEIGVLINNAASDPRIPLDTMTVAQWDGLFARNLRAYFLTAQSALPFLKTGASIINFASITYHIGATPMTAYVATKGGVMGFTRSLARELGPRGIRVNTLSPGWVMTERQKAEFVTAAVRRQLRRDQCVADLIQPEEIAEIALFLGSRVSRAMTGQEFLADRGWAYS